MIFFVSEAVLVVLWYYVGDILVYFSIFQYVKDYKHMHNSDVCLKIC